MVAVVVMIMATSNQNDNFSGHWPKCSSKSDGLVLKEMKNFHLTKGFHFSHKLTHTCHTRQDLTHGSINTSSAHLKMFKYSKLRCQCKDKLLRHRSFLGLFKFHDFEVVQVQR